MIPSDTNHYEDQRRSALCTLETIFESGGSEKEQWLYLEKIRGVMPQTLYFEFGVRLPGFIPWIFRHNPNGAKTYYKLAEITKDNRLIAGYREVLREMHLVDDCDEDSHRQILAQDQDKEKEIKELVLREKEYNLLHTVR